LKNKDYRNLSNLLLFKLQFQNNEFEQSLETLRTIEYNSKGNSYLNKIIKYYYSQVFMEQNNKKNFDIYTNELLAFGGMWALLAHELRGHFQFANKDYENALKNFIKIIQNQQSNVSIRNRAQEMIDNINLYYDKSN
jgi:predicted negative regulator of RcsB-dependent stress response